MLMFMQSGKLEDEAFDLDRLRSAQVKMAQVFNVELLGQQGARNVLRQLYPSEEAQMPVELPGWLVEQQAFNKVGRAPRSESAPPLRQGSRPSLWTHDTALPPPTQAAAMLNNTIPFDMLRLSAHIHGWSVQRVKDDDVKRMEVFSRDTTGLSTPSPPEATRLADRVHHALIMGDAPATAYAQRFDLARRVIISSKRFETKGGQNNDPKVVEEAIRYMATNGEASAGDPHGAVVTTLGWPQGFYQRWQSIPRGLARASAPLTPAESSAAIRAATAAARAAVSLQDRTNPTCDALSAIVRDTVVRTGDDMQEFVEANHGAFRKLADGEGDKESLIYKMLDFFGQRDPEAGLPSGCEYAAMVESMAKVWRVVRATQGRSVADFEAAELASVDRGIVSKAKPKMYARELELLHELLRLIGVAPAEAFSGRAVSVPADTLGMFSSPVKGCGETYFYYEREGAPADEQQRVRACAKRVEAVCTKLAALVGGSMWSDELGTRTKKPIRKMVTDKLGAFGLIFTITDKQRVVQLTPKQAAAAAASEERVAANPEKKGKGKGKGKGRAELGDAGPGGGGGRVQKRVAESATLRLNPIVQKVASHMLVKLENGTRVPLWRLRAAHFSDDDALPPPPAPPQPASGAAGGLGAGPAEAGPPGGDPMELDADTRVYVEEGNFAALHGQRALADARVRAWEQRLGRASNDHEERVIGKCLADARAKRTCIDNILYAVDDEDGSAATIKTTYSTRGMMMGRRFADGPSIQHLGKQDRARVATGFYYDIDIANCHPTLTSQLPIVLANPKRYELPLSYARDRTPFWALVTREYGCDEGWAKVLFIRMLYGGGHRAWLTEGRLTGRITHVSSGADGHQVIELIDEFQSQCRRLIEDVANARPDVLDRARVYCGNEGLFAQQKCAFSYIMTEVEDKVLATMEEVARERGWSIAVLLYDGGLLRKRAGMAKADATQLLRVMERAIKERLHVNVRLLVKDFQATDAAVQRGLGAGGAQLDAEAAAAAQQLGGAKRGQPGHKRKRGLPDSAVKRARR